MPGPLQPEEILILAPMFAITIAPFYFGWRFVRALERRNTAAKELERLNAEVSALRDQTIVMVDDLKSLSHARGGPGPRVTGDALPLRGGR